MTPTIEINTITRETGAYFYSVWFWVDGKCAHIGHFDTKYEAQTARDAVMEAVELTRRSIRNLI